MSLPSWPLTPALSPRVHGEREWWGQPRLVPSIRRTSATIHTPSLRPTFLRVLYLFCPRPPEPVKGTCMFGFGKRGEGEAGEAAPPGAALPAGGPSVSTKLCTETYNGKYPTVGLYDCKARK